MFFAESSQHRAAVSFDYTFHDVSLDDARADGIRTDTALSAFDGNGSQGADTAIAVFIDELQYVEEPQLVVLITAMHRTEQRRLPVVLVGAGLPQLRGQMGNANPTLSDYLTSPLLEHSSPSAARTLASLSTTNTISSRGLIASRSPLREA